MAVTCQGDTEAQQELRPQFQSLSTHLMACSQTGGEGAVGGELELNIFD